MADRFCLPPAYRSRPAAVGLCDAPDEPQREVYAFAADIAAGDPSVRTVLDWGTGSGSKLVESFSTYDTLGVDVPARLPHLTARYPDRRWAAVPVPAVADLILCVDVLEHLDDPAALLRTFAAGTWRNLILSTPERRRLLAAKYRHLGRFRSRMRGPPGNPAHCREWTASEFARFIRREIGIDPAVRILGKWNLVSHCHR